MAIINGRNLNLYYRYNGVLYIACYATDCKLVLTGETLETTTKNGLKGKTFNYSGKYGYTLSLTGITSLIDVIGTPDKNISPSIFQDYILQSNKMDFIFTDSENIEWSGTVLITQVDTDSPVSNMSTFANTMLGDGDLTKITTEIVPPPTESNVNIIDQLNNIIASIPAPGTYAILRFNNIDCGGAVQSSPLITMQAS